MHKVLRPSTHDIRKEISPCGAVGPAVVLAVSDWQNDAEPGGPVGKELVFNNIDVHPYLDP
jgi:hypothetical protein